RSSSSDPSWPTRSPWPSPPSPAARSWWRARATAMKRTLAGLAQRGAEAARRVADGASLAWRRWREGDAAATPGRTLRLQASSVDGRLAAWPPVAPRRAFELYLPAGVPAGAAVPLLVWIHGCRQRARDFAAGTRIRAHADARGIA